MRAVLRYAALTAAVFMPVHEAAAQSCNQIISAAQNAAVTARVYAEAAEQAADYANRSRQRDAVIEARRAQARANTAARKAQVAQAQAASCGYASAPSRPSRNPILDTADAFIPEAEESRNSPWNSSGYNPGAEVAGGLLAGALLGAGIGMGRSRRGGQLPRQVAPGPHMHPGR